MAYQNNSFYTQSFKEGFIHTWMTATGEKVQAQLGCELYNKATTVIGAKRWLTKRLREIQTG